MFIAEIALNRKKNSGCPVNKCTLYVIQCCFLQFTIEFAVVLALHAHQDCKSQLCAFVSRNKKL
uniref:Uncharacterized protein n=1 Tax=Arundo donax TaxID=35708 RepID=A0A0A9ICN8_ARUDO